MNFRKKGGGHATPKNFVADFSTSRKKRNIDIRNKGGGSKDVWTLSENSSDLVSPVVPYGKHW